MFRPITQSLARKEREISERSSISVLARRAIQEYLGEMYPGTVMRVDVRYDPNDKSVHLLTPSKTLAGELMLNTGEIRAYLASRNVRVGRIVAR